MPTQLRACPAPCIKALLSARSHARPLFTTRLKQRESKHDLRKVRTSAAFLHVIIVASVIVSVNGAGSSMSIGHAVGESTVVPGLKLTDHTFQVPISKVHK